MSEDHDEHRSADVDSGAAVDFDRLSLVAERLAVDDRFAQVTERPEFAPDRVVCYYESGFYPAQVESARLEIVWYENGDFSLHYHEDHEHGSFDHRWDRHRSAHNSRDHIHPGPDAPTPGQNASFPRGWRDVLQTGLAEIERRQKAFWS